MKGIRITLAARTVILYALIGGVWVLASHRVVNAVVKDPLQMVTVQIYKDWFFILATGLLLFLYITRENKKHKAAEENFSSIFEHALEGIFQSTLEGRFITVNPAMTTLFGYDSAREMIESVQSIGRQIYVDPQMREYFIAELLKSGAVEKFENQNYRKDGTIFWTSMNARLVRDQNGAPLYIEGFITEITDSKLAKDALQASEDQYRRLVEHSPYAVAVHSQGLLVYLNQAGVKLVGADSANELYGTPIMNFVHPDSRPEAIKRVQELALGKEAPPLREKFIRKNGSILDVEVSAYLFTYQNKPAVQVIIRDLTEQKAAEQAIRASEERFSKAFHASPIPTCITTMQDGRFIDANDAFLKLSKWQRKDIIGRTTQELNIYKFDNREKFLERLLKRQITQGEENKFVNSLGEEFDVASFYEMIDIGGQPCILSMFHDRTEQKQAQEAIRFNEEKLRAIIDHTQNIYYSHNADHILTYMSGQTKNILGYEANEALINWKNFLTDHPINQRGLLLTQRAIDTGEAQEPYVLELKAKDGHRVWVEVRETPIVRDGKTVSIVGVLIDITERKEAEERMERQLAELTVLHAVATASSQSNSEDEVIGNATQIIGGILYPDNCGILMLNQEGTMLKPHKSYRGSSLEMINEAFPITKGITGKVAASGHPIRINDISTEPAYIEDAAGICSELCVPIRVNEHIIGVLNAESRKLNGFDEEDERVMNTLAGTLGTAIERIRLFKAEQNGRKQAEHLRETTLALTTTLEPKELFEIILDAIQKLLPYESASIELFNNGYIEIVAARGLPTENQYIGIRYPSSPEKWAGPEKMREPIIVADVMKDDRFKKLKGTEYIRSWMGIPMFTRGKVIGFLNLDSSVVGFYTKEHAALAQTLGNQAAIAIENAFLYKSEQRRYQEAEKLRLAATTIASSLNLKEVLDILLKALKDVVPYDSASILLPEGEQVRIVAAHGLPDQDRALNELFPASNKLLQHILADNQPLIIADAQLDDRFEKWAASGFVRGWMGIPLVARGQVFGFITLDSITPGAFDSDKAFLAQSFAHQAATAIEKAQLFESLQKSNLELSQAYDTTLEGWGQALELKDKETQGHTLRVTALTLKLARRLGFSKEQLVQLRRGVLVHDIGKMGVPDSILQKKGSLTKKEWEEMRKHPQYAFNLLYPITYLRPALDIPYCHHEWWDGSGYPRGLRETQIPLAARIFAVVDVWDALLYERPYRKAWTKKKIINYLREQAGIHFDPEIVDAFLKMIQEENKK
ncbi:MAG: PAS domain S-box protein [Chloroflexi bacterium]|nr:PAS domain S-box protein [Chloroflexota bacterium]MBI3339330.1 PAS domain S-box protein [Chloroflexota bacterium]